MPLNVTQEGEQTRVALDGEWTIFTAEEAQDELFGLLNRARFALDLSGIIELDGFGAQMLAILLSEARRMGKPATIAASNPLVDEVGVWLGFAGLADGGVDAEGDEHGS
jgi:anti-anti-sigma regulatory factor